MVGYIRDIVINMVHLPNCSFSSKGTRENKITMVFNPLVGTTSKSGRLLIWAKRPKAAGDSRECSAVPYMVIFVNIASVLGHNESYRFYFQYGGLL